jgi:hypothetical protein
MRVAQFDRGSQDGRIDRKLGAGLRRKRCAEDRLKSRKHHGTGHFFVGRNASPNLRNPRFKLPEAFRRPGHTVLKPGNSLWRTEKHQAVLRVF